LGERREPPAPGHEEGAVAPPPHFTTPPADRRSEDDKVERGRDHGRRDALQNRALRALHFGAVNRPDAAQVDCRNGHAARPTRSTKMSSSVVVLVSRSLKWMPISLRRRKSVGTPVSSAPAEKRYERRRPSSS